MTDHAHILIVEDEPAAREAMAILLRDEGYDVTTASDAVAALEEIEHRTPDLVLSDVRMPRGDGFHLVRRLRARAATARLPVLLVSALAESNRRVAGLDLGADDFLPKPVDPGELLARVRAHLRRARERDELERRALRDALTGVLNRRGIGAVLRRELAHAETTRASLSVLMIDIDRFKRLNDEHGHQAGDTVLRHVARALTEAVRIADQVGRYGGDEFVVVLPDADANAAAALAGRLREVKLPLLAIDGGEPLTVTISVGAATCIAGDTIDALLERADRAMYRVKRASEPPGAR